ncbi:MAG: hypothetical protein NC209_02185 [Alistipes sp.]|nr:hypothetical protein [Alistipes sp.]
MPRSFRHPFQRLLHAPASGYRNETTGALGDVGVAGRYWASTAGSASSANAGFLFFGATNVNPLNEGSRAIGRSVRCVQHLQLLFLKNNLFLLRPSSFGPE